MARSDRLFRRLGRLAFVGVFSLLQACLLQAQVTPISITGPTYTQNFDTLPSAGNINFTGSGVFPVPTSPTTSLLGWEFDSGTNPVFRANNGGANNLGVYSYGSNGSTDRALGSLAGAALSPSFGAIFVNNSGSALNSITITYTGEQWRRAPNPNTLSFAYSVGATSIVSGTFTSFSALNFTGPQTGAAGALNGNLAANQVHISATITGLNWTAGSNLVIRWDTNPVAGANAGLAVDNFSLAIPEPATVAAGIGALVLLAWKWRARRTSARLRG
jgi:hypothetical protein